MMCDLASCATNWNSAGLYAFQPIVFDELERVPCSPRGEYELTSAVAQLVADGKDVRLYALLDAWRDIGRPEDLIEGEWEEVETLAPLALVADQ